jgi:hypothetical protein
MGRGGCYPGLDERRERTRGTERSGEPAPPMGSLKPVGLLPLPVEPLIWDL